MIKYMSILCMWSFNLFYFCRNDKLFVGGKYVAKAHLLNASEMIMPCLFNGHV